MHDEKDFIIKNALNRRHLNTFQKAEIGYREYHAEESEKAIRRKQSGKKIDLTTNLLEGPNTTVGEVDRIIATKVGIKSVVQFRKAVKIIKNGSEELKERCRCGLNINRGYKEVEKLLKEQMRIEKAKAASLVTVPDKLFNKDLRTITADDIPDGTIDLMIADPPWDNESVPLYSDVARLAMRVLKDGCVLVVYPTEILWYDVAERIVREGLKPWPILDIHYEGGGTAMRRATAMDDKHLFVFVKGEKPRIDNSGSNRIVSLAKPKKIDHEWEQAPEGPEYAIRRWTEIGDFVFDPCMGAGTSGVAAVKLSRQFIGNDIDPIAHEISKANISDCRHSLGKL